MTVGQTVLLVWCMLVIEFKYIDKFTEVCNHDVLLLYLPAGLFTPCHAIYWSILWP